MAGFRVGQWRCNVITVKAVMAAVAFGELTDLHAAFVRHQQIRHLQVPDNEIEEEEEDEAAAHLLSR